MDINSTVKLNNGMKMPVLAFGTWKSEEGKVAKAIEQAISVGFRHIDCSPIYKNEHEVGQGIKRALESKEERLKREDLFITSKLWNNCHRKEHVEEMCKQSLKDLGVDYVDLFLIHWPLSFPYVKDEPMPKDSQGKHMTEDVPIRETWQAMEDLVKKGLTKAIGVSNFSIDEVEQILAFASIKPAVNQVECHPYLHQKEMKTYLDSKGIVMQAYSPLGQYEDEQSPMEDPVVEEIAKKHKKTPTHILLRWGVDRGYVVITKSTTPEHIKQNADIFNFKLTDDDVRKINELGDKKQHRLNNPPFKNGQPVFQD